jgi:hypothetical protein
MNPNNNLQKYKLEKEIGEGQFGNVFLANDNINNRKVAIKRINKKNLEYNDYLKSALRKEISIMKLCKCKYSVELYEEIESNTNYNLVMEICDGDLFDLLKLKNGFSYNEIKKIMNQLNVVFKIMQNNHIMHRDLKLKNILYKFTNNSKSEFDVKLSDFGFSKEIGEGNITCTILGTPITMAPELLKKQKYTNEADLWSIGVIIYQMYFNSFPFFGYNNKMILNDIIKKKGIPAKIPKESDLADLLGKIFKINPNERITWENYFKHPFFNNEDDIKKNKIENNKNERYKNIVKFDSGYEDNNYSCFICEDILTGQKIIVKKYDLKLVNKFNKIFRKIINISIQFKQLQKALQYIKDYEEKGFLYIEYSFVEGEILLNYIKKNNDINEKKLGEMNRIFYEDVLLFTEYNEINIDFYSIYSILVDKNGNFILFDYGFMKYILPNNIINEYYSISPIEINQPFYNTGVLTYGITLLKVFFGENFKILIDNGTQINLNDSKKCSNEFIQFLSNLLRRNYKKRYLFSSFGGDKFCYEENNNNEVKLNDDILIFMFDNIENRYNMIVDYYKSIDFNLNENQKYIQVLFDFLQICLIEIDMISGIFLNNKKKFSNQEEITFIIFDSEQNNFDHMTINLGSIPDIQKIFNNKNNPIIIDFLKKIQNNRSAFFELVKKLNKILNYNSFQNKSMSFLEEKIMNIHNSNNINYFNSIFSNAIDLFNEKKISLAHKEFLISEYFCEYLISMKIFTSENANKNLNRFDILNKLFIKDFSNIYLTTIKTKTNENDNENKFIYISFMGGMFKYYYEELMKKQENFYSKSLLTSSEETFNSLIGLYPSVMRYVIDSDEFNIQK